MQKKAVELRPEESVYRSELALTYNNLGAVQSRSGAVAQAAESYARVVDLASELVRQSPAQKSYRRTLAVGFNNLGLAQSKLGHATAAEPSFRHALALQETLVKQDPRDVDLQSALGGMYNNLGIVLEELNRSADAVQAYQQAVAHQQQAVASAPEMAQLSTVSQQALLQLRPGAAANGTPRRRRPGRLGTPRTVAQESAALVLRRRGTGLDRQGSFRRRGTRARIRPTGGEITADQCGAYAVETLKQATAAGWKPAPEQQLDQILPGNQEPCRLLGIDEELTRNLPWPNTDDDLLRITKHERKSSARLRLECLETRSLLSAIGLPLVPPVAPPSAPAAAGEFYRIGGQHVAQAAMQDAVRNVAATLHANPTLTPDRLSPDPAIHRLYDHAGSLPPAIRLRTTVRRGSGSMSCLMHDCSRQPVPIQRPARLDPSLPSNMHCRHGRPTECINDFDDPDPPPLRFSGGHAPDAPPASIRTCCCMG